ncbi:MAG: hypothetical protein ACFFCW_25115 [Candidatus Hodarchaeota archaeon]
MGDRVARYQLAGLIDMDDSYFGGPGQGTAGRGAEGKAPVVLAVKGMFDIVVAVQCSYRDIFI